VIEGKNNPSQAVTWTVSSKADGSGKIENDTNISPSGTLNISAKETAQSIYVRATSMQDESKYDYMRINLTTGVVVQSDQQKSKQEQIAQSAAQSVAQKAEKSTSATETETVMPAKSSSKSSAKPATPESNFKTSVSNGKVTITGYNFTGDYKVLEVQNIIHGYAVNIPETINNMPVTAIGANALANVRRTDGGLDTVHGRNSNEPTYKPSAMQILLLKSFSVVLFFR